MNANLWTDLPGDPGQPGLPGSPGDANGGGLGGFPSWGSKGKHVMFLWTWFKKWCRVVSVVWALFINFFSQVLLESYFVSRDM